IPSRPSYKQRTCICQDRLHASPSVSTATRETLRDLSVQPVVLLLQKCIGDDRDAQSVVYVAACDRDGLTNALVDPLELLVDVGPPDVVHCNRTAAAMKKNERASAVSSIWFRSACP